MKDFQAPVRTGHASSTQREHPSSSWENMKFFLYILLALWLRETQLNADPMRIRNNELNLKATYKVVDPKHWLPQRPNPKKNLVYGTLCRSCL
jgi:hypothetical protein